MKKEREESPKMNKFYQKVIKELHVISEKLNEMHSLLCASGMIFKRKFTIQLKTENLRNYIEELMMKAPSPLRAWEILGLIDKGNPQLITWKNRLQCVSVQLGKDSRFYSTGNGIWKLETDTL